MGAASRDYVRVVMRGASLFVLSSSNLVQASVCGLPPAPGFQRVAVISDLNSEFGSEAYEPRVAHAVNRVIASAPAFVLSTGDMVAGQWKNLGREKLRAMWASFHRTISEPLYRAGLPLAVTPGNHDASPNFLDDQIVFRESWFENEGKPFEQPSKYFRQGARLQGLDLARYPFRYSFSYGGALFIGIDATMIGPLAVEQKQWIRAELARHAWFRPKIVFGHIPFQPVALKRVREALFDAGFERELRMLDVDAYVSGHHHAYFPGQLESSLLQISVGALGQGQRALIGRTQNSPPSFLLIDWSPASNGLRWSSCAGEDFNGEENESELPESIAWAVGSQSGRILKSDSR